MASGTTQAGEHAGGIGERSGHIGEHAGGIGDFHASALHRARGIGREKSLQGHEIRARLAPSDIRLHIAACRVVHKPEGLLYSGIT